MSSSRLVLLVLVIAAVSAYVMFRRKQEVVVAKPYGSRVSNATAPSRTPSRTIPSSTTPTEVTSPTRTQTVLDCLGYWTAGACDATTKQVQSKYFIVREASGGGKPCPFKMNDVKASDCKPDTSSDTSSATAAVDCIGDWVDAGCDDLGVKIRKFTVKTPASNGGKACAFKDGHIEQTAGRCGPVALPIDCVGDWMDAGCDDLGVRIRKFAVKTQASNGGKACAVKDGHIEQTAGRCHPIDCVGEWVLTGKDCNGTLEMNTEKYSVITQPIYGGKACPYSDGQTRRVATKEKTGRCGPVALPIDCVGDWVDAGCDDLGVKIRKFTVKTPASNGGKACAFGDGHIEQTTGRCDIDTDPYAWAIGIVPNLSAPL